MNCRLPTSPRHTTWSYAPGGGVAGVLHAQVVLVGEEVRHPVVGRRPGRAWRGRRRGRRSGRWPSARRAAGGRAAGARRWRRRRRRRCPGRRCAGEASTAMPPPASRAAIARPAASASAVRGAAPMAASTSWAGCSWPSSVRAARTMPSCPVISVSRAPKWKRTPCSPCRSVKTAPSSGPRTRVQRGRAGLDDGDLGAVAAGGGGDLQADPARAGDDQVAVLPAEAGEDVLEPVGVREAAQVVHARRGRCRGCRGGAAPSRWRAAACRRCRVVPSPRVTVLRVLVEAARRAGRGGVRRRARRTSRAAARRRSRAPRCRSGSPWTAAAARRGGRARRRSVSPGR